MIAGSFTVEIDDPADDEQVVIDLLYGFTGDEVVISMGSGQLILTGPDAAMRMILKLDRLQTSLAKQINERQADR